MHRNPISSFKRLFSVGVRKRTYVSSAMASVTAALCTDSGNGGGCRQARGGRRNAHEYTFTSVAILRGAALCAPNGGTLESYHPRPPTQVPRAEQFPAR